MNWRQNSIDVRHRTRTGAAGTTCGARSRFSATEALHDSPIALLFGYGSNGRDLDSILTWTDALGSLPAGPEAPETGSSSPRGPAPAHVSDILGDFIDTFPSDRIALADLVAAMGPRAFGMLFLVLALPNAVPIPGISTIFGVPMILLGAQLLFGLPRPWLPARLGRLDLERSTMRRMLDRTKPYLAKVERLSRPRALAFTGATAERCVGFMVLVLGIILIFPIWGGNLPPAVAIAVMSIGLMDRDGLFVLGGLLFGVVAIMIVAAVIASGAALIAFSGEIFAAITGFLGI